MSLPPIVDPHVHFWAVRDTPRRPTPLVKLLGWSRRLTEGAARLAFPGSTLDFVGRIDHVIADYLPATYREDASGLDVQGIVHVEAGWQGRKPVHVAHETRWLDQLDGQESILGIVGAADLASPHLDAQLDAHQAASSRFRGVRDKLACSPRRNIMDWSTASDHLTNPTWRRGYAKLGERGLTFDAWMYSHQLPAFREVAAAHPETKVMLDHVGTPIGLGGPYGGLTATERTDIAARWEDDLAALGELPHVHVKLSGLTMPVLGFGLHERAPIDADALAEAIGPYLRRAIDIFGVERCAFASNFPMDKVSASLGTLYGAFDRVSSDFTDAERRELFAGTARRFYAL